MLNDKPTVSTACMYYALTKGKHMYSAILTVN